jgi:hypothetical protein
LSGRGKLRKPVFMICPPRSLLVVSTRPRPRALMCAQTHSHKNQRTHGHPPQTHIHAHASMHTHADQAGTQMGVRKRPT